MKRWMWGPLAAAGAVGVAVVVGSSAVKRSGRRVAARHDATADRRLVPPTDVRTHWVDTHDGGVIHVKDTEDPHLSNGDRAGRPVLLLHGVTLQWWVWAPTIAVLRRRHRVLAWDMRGHGESRAGSDGATIDACAEDLKAVLESLDLHDVIVVGHSMGGMLLGKFSDKYRSVLAQRVAGRVFLATSAATVSINALRGVMVALAGRLEARHLAGKGAIYGWKRSDASMGLTKLAFGPGATAAMVDDVRSMVETIDRDVLMSASRSLAAHDVRASLAEVDGATLVVVGEKDLLTPPTHARGLEACIKGAELVTLPGIGHQVMQEAPDELAAAIEAFDSRLVTGDHAVRA